METTATVDEIYESVINALSPEDRLRLAARLAAPSGDSGDSAGVSGYDWMAVRGIAPDLFGGEDAQEWVSRSRADADREHQWQHDR